MVVVVGVAGVVAVGWVLTNWLLTTVGVAPLFLLQFATAAAVVVSCSFHDNNKYTICVID